MMKDYHQDSQTAMQEPMTIHIRKASEHNLKEVSLDIPDGLTAVTGISGSGKTSLIFDTLHHESRRRFYEIFSGGSADKRLSPAEVEGITGLRPSVSLSQNLLNRNPHSTLATACGLHPFLRLFYSHFGERLCSKCGSAVNVMTEDEIIVRLLKDSSQSSIQLMAPLVNRVKGSHRTLIRFLAKEFGATSLEVDGEAFQDKDLNPFGEHSIFIKLGRFGPDSDAAEFRKELKKAWSLGSNAVMAKTSGESRLYSHTRACSECGELFDEPAPVYFHTACPHCRGRGCEKCTETGMHPTAASVFWQGLRFRDMLRSNVKTILSLFKSSDCSETADRLLLEITMRLEALRSVGLDYLTLDRPSPTLSRGESQRVRLAVILTSRLSDMLYVLDEPTIGLHPVNIDRIISVFHRLKGPVIFVEHDRRAAAASDYAVELGPGTGKEGGRLQYAGSPAGLWKSDTVTGEYFSLKKRASIPEKRPEPEEFVIIRSAFLRNLRNIDVKIPLKNITVVTGVSGAGKSTLAEDVITASLKKKKPVGCISFEGPALRPLLADQSPIGKNPRSNPATYTKLSDLIRDLFSGSTGLSPAHFSFNRPEGACPVCKGLGSVEVRMRYLAADWLVCSECGGRRFSDEVLTEKVDFNGKELSIADFYELSVSEARELFLRTDKLDKKEKKKAERILKALCDIGLGYLPLGQPSPSLSGGESQRIKLGRYLNQKRLADRMLILDEPTTGLHPHDISGLLKVLDELCRRGATIVIVEHNPDMISAADWAIDLGPGAGDAGGCLLYVGPARDLMEYADESLTGKALLQEEQIRPAPEQDNKRRPRTAAPVISIRKASIHNLKNIDVDIPKSALTVVTGVSGSGKSSLVDDVLYSEAMRRYLETLSLYERQGTKEGPEAPADSIEGLGVTLGLKGKRKRFDRRSTVGSASELSHHLEIIFAFAGIKKCENCNVAMTRKAAWVCPRCGNQSQTAQPRRFSPVNYSAACLKCHGIGTLQMPKPDKLIINPGKPLCRGAMHSPGFFPKGYLCKPFNGGYDMLQALAGRYGFNPDTTPWNEMTPEAQRAFLFGDNEPLTAVFHSRNGTVKEGKCKFPGFYGFIRDWDIGGAYTETVPCPECKGARLRPEYLAVEFAGYNIHEIKQMSLIEAFNVIQKYPLPDRLLPLIGQNISVMLNRLNFLMKVGLGYLNMDRLTAELSAGEAQRIKLAGFLGSELSSLTLLLDEPTRGMHPSEVESLLDTLKQLRDDNNTVIVVEHDPLFIKSADHIIDMGPGAGAAGGRVAAQGTPEQMHGYQTPTARWLRKEITIERRKSNPKCRRWMTVKRAFENNLRLNELRFPLKKMTGLCGVSGSGKSTLLIDTIGRALAPRKHTTSVAYEPLMPGKHGAIEGAPARVIIIDQTKAGITSPSKQLKLQNRLRRLFAESEDAKALGLDMGKLSRPCSACRGAGRKKLDMGFLPDVYETCETCDGTGYPPEIRQIKIKNKSLPEISRLTLDQVYELFGETDQIARPLSTAREVGLGYLVMDQPGYALSGGEAQRLKIACELGRKTIPDTLYILDEPTVGQHISDIQKLIDVLHRLVEQGHTVIAIEHHPHFLAICDWLVELGPGGGPDGGKLIAQGTPEELADGNTPTAPFIREALERSLI